MGQWFAILGEQGSDPGEVFSHGHRIAALVEQEGLQPKAGGAAESGKVEGQTACFPSDEATTETNQSLMFCPAFTNGYGAGTGQSWQVGGMEKDAAQAQVSATIESGAEVGKADLDHPFEGNTQVAAVVRGHNDLHGKQFARVSWLSW